MADFYQSYQKTGICKVYNAHKDSDNEFLCECGYEYEYEYEYGLLKSINTNPIQYCMSGFIKLEVNLDQNCLRIILNDGTKLLSYGSNEKRWAMSHE